MPWGTQDVSPFIAAFCCLSQDPKALGIWWKGVIAVDATSGMLCGDGTLQDCRAARARAWSGRGASKEVEFSRQDFREGTLWSGFKIAILS